MKSSFKNLPSSIVELNVELTLEEFNEYWQPIFDQALSQVHLKGFRPGQAPREMAKNAVDQEKVFEKAAHEAIRFSLNKIAEENNWTIIDKPQVNIDSHDKGFKYTAKLTLFPEIKLGDYKKIAKKWCKKFAEEKKDITVTEKEVDDSIEWLRNSRAKLTETDRPAQIGDVVEITDVVQNKPDKFILGQGNFLPDFENNLKNHAKGEGLNFSIEIPADYWKEDLRGKKMDFKIKINKVFNRELPELNEEFIRALGKGFDNLDSLKKSIKDGIFAEKETKEKDKNRLRIIEEIAQESKMDIPQVMIDKVEEQFGKEGAKKRVTTQLVIYKIVELENLKPNEEEINKEMRGIDPVRSLARAKGASPKDLGEATSNGIDNPKFYEYIYNVLQTRKVFEFLEKQ